MVDITVKFSDVHEDEVDNIVTTCKQSSEQVVVSIKKPWPKMALGDRFVYGGSEYLFLTYRSDDKVKCISMESAMNELYLQAVFFDCSTRSPDIKFITKE